MGDVLPAIAVALVVGCGCGRIGFDPRADAAPPAPRCSWTPAPVLGPVVHHDELSSTGLESDPQLVLGDPLTLYFARALTSGDFDVYVAQRPALGARFDPPALVTELSTPGVGEFGLVMNASGDGYFASTATGNPDLYEVHRDTTGALRVGRAMSELNDAGAQLDPFATADGLTLWFSIRPANNQLIEIASRADSGSPWSTVIPFSHNTAGEQAGASTTADQLLVVWTMAPSATSEADIYYAVRASVADPWGPAQLLAPGVISTSMQDLEPSVRDDGCELFFARSASALDQDWDIYSVTVL